MKRLILLYISFFLYLSMSAQFDTLIINGYYSGKEVRVMQSSALAQKDYCIVNWSVNGESHYRKKFNSTFELENYMLRIGDPIEIKIVHRPDCKPNISNPEALWPKSTFQIVKMSLKSDDMLTWISTSETGSLPWYIEQYKWDDWQIVGSIKGVGTPEKNVYQFPVSLCPGTNYFRVFQIGCNFDKKVSDKYQFDSKGTSLKLEVDSSDCTITFPKQETHQLFDSDGSLIYEGDAVSIEMTSYKDGKYYLNVGCDTYVITLETGKIKTVEKQ